jgi:hypothetical protein
MPNGPAVLDHAAHGRKEDLVVLAASRVIGYGRDAG